MKIRQNRDSRNQHIIAIEQGDELRCYFRDSSLSAVGAALQSLLRDIANHGEAVVEFESLPLVSVRVSNSGRKIYEVAPVSSVGRPSTMDGGKKVNTYLDAESVELAKKLGNGNVSDGIRKALKQVAK